MEWRQLLHDAGFVLHSKCKTCGGTPYEKYRNANKQGIYIKVFPVKEKFKVLQFNRATITAGIDQLETTLQTL